jgi:hypothetical protein
MTPTKTLPLASMFLSVLVLLFPGRARGQQDETLAGVLAQNSVSFQSISIPHLNDAITSYTTLNTDREFLIAYYLVVPRNELHFPLLLTRLDKQSGKWQEASLTDLKVKMSEGTEPEPWDCIGSALRFERNGDWYYLDLHLTPSAGCVVILNHDLTVHQTLTGWTVAFLKSGLVVYEGNMVHFAPVHAETLFLYDPVAQQSQQIYPQTNDPFRKNFSDRLEAVIDEKRCRENNWPCDPNDFETSIGPIEVNDETHSLAFRVGFGPEGFVPREEAEGNGKWDDDEYVYVYQLAPLRWREFSVYDLKPKFGTDSLKDLLTPEKLRQVFATPSPR